MDLIFFYAQMCRGCSQFPHNYLDWIRKRRGNKKGLFALIARRRGYLKALPKGFRDLNERIDGFCTFDIRAVAEIQLTKLVRSFIDR